MRSSKFFRLLAVLLMLALALAACTTADSGDTGPADAPAAETEPTEEPAAEPTEELAAEPTDEPAEPTAEATDEPAAVPTDAPVADSDGPVEMVMAKTVSCYLEPGASSDALGTILEGTTVKVLGRGVGAGWLAIEYPKDATRVCWITEGDVVYDGEFSELPIYGRSEGGDEEDDEPIVLPEGDEYPVLSDVLCLRGPGGGYSTVRALLEGEIVIVHGRGVGMGWYVVAIPSTGDNCWLPDTAVDFTGVYEDLKIFATPPKS